MTLVDRIAADLHALHGIPLAKAEDCARTALRIMRSGEFKPFMDFFTAHFAAWGVEEADEWPTLTLNYFGDDGLKDIAKIDAEDFRRLRAGLEAPDAVP